MVEPKEQLTAAFADERVPKIYANAFGLGLSNADIPLVLFLSQKPVAVVHLSYTLAKTLQAQLGQVMADFESATGRKILRTDEVDVAFKQMAASPEGKKQ
jgi:hypothetical protein